jgi:hypothetical protein
LYGLADRANHFYNNSLSFGELVPHSLPTLPSIISVCVCDCSMVCLGIQVDTCTYRYIKNK